MLGRLSPDERYSVLLFCWQRFSLKQIAKTIDLPILVCIVGEYHKVFNLGEYDNISSMCRNATIGCTTCKKRLSEVLKTFLSPIREKRKYLEEKPRYLKDILHFGSEKARTEGSKTLENVKEAMSIQYL